MEESVLLGTKPLVDSYATSSGTRVAYFPYVTFASVVSFNDVTIPAFCFCSIFSLHVHVKRTLHVGEKIWILCSSGKNNYISLARYCSCHSNIKFISSRHHVHVISSIYTICTLYTSVSQYFKENVVHDLCWWKNFPFLAIVKKVHNAPGL